MDYRVHRYRSACGRLDLAARDYPADGRPTLLLMHGLTRNSADFEPLAAHLAGHYRLIVPDQRGRGLSQWDSDPANYRPDIYAGDMFALLQSLGIDRAMLIGTSMGGLISMVMAAMKPDAVPAMVLNDVGAVLAPEGLARIQSYVGPAGPMASWEEAAARCRATNAVAFPDFGEADWLAFARRTCVEQADGTIVLAYDPAVALSVSPDTLKAEAPDLWPLWDMLTAVPTMVIRGALTDLLTMETAREMGERHQAIYELVEVPNVGHAPILDEPVALAAIERFVKEHAN